MGHWAKIIACRITQIGGTAPNPLQGALKTTWADFIDLLNSILVMGGIYNFPYTEEWSEIVIVLGNQVGIECIWEYCTCTTLSGPPTCQMCDINIMNYYWLSTPVIVPMIDISTIYNGGALTTPVTSIVNLPDDAKQAVDIITNPANGLFNTNTKELKWEKMPATGPGGAPMLPGPATTCTPNRYQQNGWTDCDLYEYGFGPDGGNYFKLEYGFWLGGAAGAYFGPNFINGWDTWADLLNAVKPVINASQGIPTNMLVTNSDNFDELTTKLEWYYINVLQSAAVEARASWMWDYRPLCGCTGQTNTNSYDPCHCEPIYGPGGYPTSAACEAVCCSGETSWSCNTGTIIVWEDSTDCHNRTTYLPNVFTTNTISNPNSPLGFIANQTNGFQSVLFSDLKFAVTPLGFASNTASHPCYDVDEVMIPDGNAHWWHLVQVMTGTFGTPNYIVSTLSWKDFIAQASGPPWNHPVDTTMSTSQVLGVFGGSMGYSMGPCTCTGTPCECVEIAGTTGYPTSASCEVVCCSGTSMDLWECTGVGGCLQTSNGTHASLSDCESVCQEWECTPSGPCYGNCDTVGVGAPRVELPNSVWGDLTNMMPYFADPATPPLQHPNLPTIVGNMQNTSIKYYKYDCSTCQLTNVCLSPHGSWFAPATIYVVNLPGLPYMSYIGGNAETWVDVVDGLNLIGYTFGYNTPYTTIASILSTDGKQMVVMGESCFGTTGPCDCVLIDGTGHTGTWTIGDYNDCYSSCCQTQDTWDCELTGCILNTIGTGAYITLADCVYDCKEWECIPGINNSDSCSGQTLLNVDWSTISGGLIRMKAANYFSHQLNGVTKSTGK